MSADEYRRAMDALAREATMAPDSADRIERQLLAAISECEAADHVSSRQLRGVGWVPRFGGTRVSWRSWLPAVAALTLFVGTLFVWRTNQRLVRVEHEAVASVAPKKSIPAPAGDRPIEPPPLAVTATHAPSPNRKPPVTVRNVAPGSERATVTM